MKLEEQKEQEDLPHHEQIKEVQNTFWNQVNEVCSIIKETGNPPRRPNWRFVCARHPYDIVDTKVVETDRTVEQLGKDQYQQFVTTRLQEGTTPLFDTVQKNKLHYLAVLSLQKRRLAINSR